MFARPKFVDGCFSVEILEVCGLKTGVRTLKSSVGLSSLIAEVLLHSTPLDQAAQLTTVNVKCPAGLVSRDDFLCAAQQFDVGVNASGTESVADVCDRGFLFCLFNESVLPDKVKGHLLRPPAVEDDIDNNVLRLFGGSAIFLRLDMF